MPYTISPEKIEANRRNAQRSTGPTTPEGKAAVAQNALKHGVFARKVIAEKDDDRLQHYREQLTAEYQPRTFTETALVEQMAVALFKRIAFEEVEASLEYQIAHGGVSTLQIVWRRQAALNHEFHKALDQLQKLRKAAAQFKPKQESKPAAEPERETASTPASQTPAPETPRPDAPPPPAPGPPANGPYEYVMRNHS